MQKDEHLVYKSVLVTGGCGFIGANLCRRLLASGSHVLVLDNLSRGAAEHLHGLDIELIRGDIRDIAATERVTSGVDAIIHLAAFGSVVESVQRPEENFDVNVRGTLTILQAAAKRRLKVVFASSGGAVVGAAEPPVSEDSLPKPASPYGASKLCGEAYCHAFARSFGLHTVALRFANVYGPYSAHKRGAVTNFIIALLSREPMIIFGDGSATRDFIYVDDVCDGIHAALITQLEPGIVLHLATGIETRVDELARTLGRVAGAADYPIHFEQKRAGELERNFANFNRAQQLLGFSPRVALEDGLARTFRWFLGQGPEETRKARTDS
jgi:UDP-glucose 4-epimerase